MPLTQTGQIFHLYTCLAARNEADSASSGGLGYIDNKSNLLDITLEVPKCTRERIPAAHSRRASHAHGKGKAPSTTSSVHSTGAENRKSVRLEMQTIEVTIQQDASALRREAGNTGSVAWQSSLEFAKHILQGSASGTNDPPILRPEALGQTSVIELGSGTGILSVLLGPLVKNWTATDIATLLPLIRKNHKRNAERLALAHLSTEELDWTWTTRQMKRALLDLCCPCGGEKAETSKGFDIAVAVDCLFNEALVQPFVNTLDHLPTSVVIIVVELRSPDVLRLFLERWLASKHEWAIWRASRSGEDQEETAENLLGRRYVTWVGFRGLPDIAV